MPGFKFTQANIKAADLRPETGKAVYFDSEKRGLGMRVTPTDKRTFFMVTYLPGNKQSRSNLGAVTATRQKPGEPVLSLKQARDMIDEVNVATRHAPAPEPTTGRTMESLVKEWVEEHAAGLASEPDIKRYADEVIAAIGSKPSKHHCRPRGDEDEVLNSDVGAIVGPLWGAGERARWKVAMARKRVGYIMSNLSAEQQQVARDWLDRLTASEEAGIYVALAD